MQNASSVSRAASSSAKHNRAQLAAVHVAVTVPECRSRIRAPLPSYAVCPGSSSSCPSGPPPAPDIQDPAASMPLSIFPKRSRPSGRLATLIFAVAATSRRARSRHLRTAPQPRRLHRIAHQHRNRQRTHSARHRRNRSGDVHHVRMHIADQHRAFRTEIVSAAPENSRNLRRLRRDPSPVLSPRRSPSRPAEYIPASPSPPAPSPPPRYPRAASSPANRRVFEWQIVTVAFACSSSSAIGLPTMSLRPSTTAFAPSTGILLRRKISITPAGVHATRVRPARHQLRPHSPDETRPHPSPGPPRPEFSLHPPAAAKAVAPEFRPRRRAGSTRSTSREQFRGGDRRRRRQHATRQSQFLARRNLAVHIHFRRGIIPHQDRRQPGTNPAAASAAISPVSSP